MKHMKDVTDIKKNLLVFIRIIGVSIAISGGATGLSPRVLATQQAATAAPHVIPRLRLDEFRARQAAGSVLVVDVRDEIVFRAGHIPGALNVPLAEIDRRAGEVRTRAGERTVVTYCSCPSEQTAASAAVALSKLGIAKISVLVGGYPEWVSTGGAVEKGGR